MDVSSFPDPAQVAAQLRSLDAWRARPIEASLPEVTATLRAIDTAMRGLIPEIRDLLRALDASRATVPEIQSGIAAVLASAKRCPHLTFADP